MLTQRFSFNFVSTKATGNPCPLRSKRRWAQALSLSQPLLRLALVWGLIMLGLSGGGLAAAASGSPSKPLATAYACSEAGLDAAIAAGDTATFSVVPCSIILTSFKVIAKDLTIDGGTDGGYGLNLDGNGLQAFVVIPGVSFTLKHTQISNGNATNADGGGAILNKGGSVTIDHDQFVNNTSSTNGGAIRVEDNGTLTVTHSSFLRNTATGYYSSKGGAIDTFDGSTTILSSTFTSNTSNGYGGAVYSQSPLTITASSFTNNNSSIGGAVGAASLKLTNATLTANHATNGSGGGISVGGALEVVSSTFISNTATGSGGGIDKGAIMSMMIVDSLLQENTAAYYGGGIFSDVDVTITQSRIISNTAQMGGGVFMGADVGPLPISGSSFTGNHAPITNGGPIYGSGLLTVLTSSFTGNTAKGSGGAIFQSPNQPVALEGSSFTGNSTGGDGGAVAAQGPLTVTTSTFTANQAHGNGGGINGLNGPSLIKSSTFLTNTAEAGNGGAILLGNGGVATVEQSTFRGNTAQTHGGAVMSSIPVSITSGTFSQNTSGTGGGAIAAVNTALSVQTSAITGNTSPQGSGMYSSGSLTLTTSSLIGNTANSSGGALQLDPGSGTVTIANTTIGQNTGSGIASTSAGVQVVNSTIVNNSYALSLVTSILSVENSIIGGECENTLGITSQGHNLGTSSTCGLTQPTDHLMSYDALQLGTLTTAANGTSVYPLVAGSPARDTANPLTCPATDQRGITRPQGSGCDIGAYEATVGVRLVLTPATTMLAGVASQTVTTTLTLQNVGPVTDTYTLTVSGQTWTTTVQPTITPPVMVSGSITLTVQVVIPPNAQPGQSSTVTVTATSQLTPEQTATAQITTSVLPQQGMLPVVMRSATSGW